MKLATVMVATAFATTAFTVQAQGVYGELAYTNARVQLKDMNEAEDYPLLRGIVGFELNKFLAIEGMAGIGLNNREDSILGIPIKSKIEHTYGVFVKPKLQFNDAFSIYGRAGYARSKVSVEGLGLERSETHSGFAYGAGATYNFTPQAYLNIDYMSYYNQNGSKAHGPSVGLGYKF
jgi:opacity protein-like surface antigen